MIQFPRWMRRSTGRHRVADRRQHQGWEGREAEIRLLAEDAPETTQPIRGLPLSCEDMSCQVDQCTWPESIDDDNRPGDPEYWLLEHLRTHPRIDFHRTITRLRSANTKLQERT